MAPARSEELAVTMPSDREIVMTRAFDAPRRLVFDALTKPELLKRWLGPADWPLVVCEIDLRVGGALRYVWRQPDGTEMGLRGIFRQIARPRQIVHTQTFDEPWSSGETLVTAVLLERGGRTTLTTTVRYESREARDGALRSRMAQGVGAGYRRLDELLASLA